MSNEGVDVGKMREPVAPRSAHALFGILNPFGQFWTHETFTTPEKARDYIETFWARNINRPDTSRFEVIPVILTIEAVDPIPLSTLTPAGASDE